MGFECIAKISEIAKIQDIDKYLLIGNKIANFSTAVGNLGGSISSVQQMLRSDCMDDKIVTKPREIKNTERKRCILVPLNSLSKVRMKYMVSCMFFEITTIRAKC